MVDSEAQRAVALRHLSACAVGLLCCSCGGSLPLMHGVAAVKKNTVEVGAGFATRLVPTPTVANESEAIAQAASVAPGMAPWVSGRMGFGKGLDAGLAYSGRALRLSGRKMFGTGAFRLSLGIGALGLLPKRDDQRKLRVGGFGADLPVLVGWVSSTRRFMLWCGARQSFESLRGRRDLESDSLDPDAPLAESIAGWHGATSGLAGLKIGNDWIAAAFEMSMSGHYGELELGAQPLVLKGLAIAPAGAVLFQF